MVITVSLFAAFVVFVLVMLRNAETSSDDERIIAVHNSIVRASVSAFAFDGSFPDSLEYLTEHYNLVIDLERFAVHYDSVAGNLLPNIITVDRKTGKQFSSGGFIAHETSW
jgi:hypothetical protein